jgi:hypothetical protein
MYGIVGITIIAQYPGLVVAGAAELRFGWAGME